MASSKSASSRGFLGAFTPMVQPLLDRLKGRFKRAAPSPATTSEGMSLPGVRYGVVESAEMSVPVVQFDMHDYEERSVRSFLQDWSVACGQHDHTPLPVRAYMPRPHRVHIRNTDLHISAASAWATERYGPIDGTWEEIPSYMMTFTMRFTPGGAQAEPALTNTYFDFDNKDDAFAFKMRWG